MGKFGIPEDLVDSDAEVPVVRCESSSYSCEPRRCSPWPFESNCVLLVNVFTSITFVFVFPHLLRILRYPLLKTA